jgi:hypothetical protein
MRNQICFASVKFVEKPKHNFVACPRKFHCTKYWFDWIIRGYTIHAADTASLNTHWNQMFLSPFVPCILHPMRIRRSFAAGSAVRIKFLWLYSLVTWQGRVFPSSLFIGCRVQISTSRQSMWTEAYCDITSVSESQFGDEIWCSQGGKSKIGCRDGPVVNDQTTNVTSQKAETFNSTIMP